MLKRFLRRSGLWCLWDGHRPSEVLRYPASLSLMRRCLNCNKPVDLIELSARESQDLISRFNSQDGEKEYENVLNHPPNRS